jgi:hypothetical protein
MPDPTIAEKLKAYSILLREGRVTEADNEMTALAADLDAKALAEKLKRPAEQPMTDAELQLAVLDELDRLFGYHPRLHSLMIELHGRAEKPN